MAMAGIQTEQCYFELRGSLDGKDFCIVFFVHIILKYLQVIYRSRYSDYADGWRDRGSNRGRGKRHISSLHVHTESGARTVTCSVSARVLSSWESGWAFCLPLISIWVRGQEDWRLASTPSVCVRCRTGTSLFLQFHQRLGLPCVLFPHMTKCISIFVHFHKIIYKIYLDYTPTAASRAGEEFFGQVQHFRQPVHHYHFQFCTSWTRGL